MQHHTPVSGVLPGPQRVVLLNASPFDADRVVVRDRVAYCSGCSHTVNGSHRVPEPDRVIPMHQIQQIRARQ